MFIYLVVLLFVLLISINVIKNRVPQKEQCFFLIALFVILLIMISFRSINVGTDNIRHNYFILSSKNLFSIDDAWINALFNEPLWHLLPYLVNNFHYPIISFWILYFSLVWFFLLKAVPNGTSKLLVSCIFVLSYFYCASYNTSAQVLAAILILCSIKALNQRRIIISVFAFLAAIAIHKASLFALPFLILNYFSIPTKWYYLAFAASFLILILNFDSFLFSNINNLMMQFDQGTNMSDYYQYFEMEKLKLNAVGLLMSYFIIIANIIVFILVHLGNRNELDVYSQWWAIGIILYILTFNYAWLFRLCYFFMIPMIIAIPLRMPHNNKRKYIIAILLLAFMYVCKLYNNNDGVVPYELITQIG